MLTPMNRAGGLPAGVELRMADEGRLVARRVFNVIRNGIGVDRKLRYRKDLPRGRGAYFVRRSKVVCDGFASNCHFLQCLCAAINGICDPMRCPKIGQSDEGPSR